MMPAIEALGSETCCRRLCDGIATCGALLAEEQLVCLYLRCLRCLHLRCEGVLAARYLPLIGGTTLLREHQNSKTWEHAFLV